MKRLLSLIICLLLISGILQSASAADRYVIDDSGLLSSEERIHLETECLQFNNSTGMEIVCLTVDSLNGKSAQSFADDYFDEHYGRNGLLFLIALYDRQWHISTAGTACEVFSDAVLMKMEDNIIPYLSEGDFSTAFISFIFDASYYATKEHSSGIGNTLTIAVPVGAVIAAIVLLIMRGTMNTKVAQRSAVNYTVTNSYHLRKNLDLYLYSNVSKRARPKENSGSSTHRSSSGNIHGGRGGKF